MSRKMIVTLEFEVADIPEQERKEIISECFGDCDEEELPPMVADLSDDDIKHSVYAFFSGLGEDYHAQAEMWAGSDEYLWFKDIKIIGVTPQV